MKSALLIGINYLGSDCQLSGCINDIYDMYNMCKKLNYNNITILCDGKFPLNGNDSINTTLPTRDNIINAIKLFVIDAIDGDSLLFHYSGHGSQVESKTEADGYDETLVPVDYEENGFIIDDLLKSLLVTPLLNKKIKMRIILDCCHSGTGIDLKYNLSFVRSIKDIGSENTEDNDNYIKKMIRDQIYKELANHFDQDIIDKHMPKEKYVLAEWDNEEGNNGEKTIVNHNEFNKRIKVIGKVALDVIMLSGCSDSQTSADASFNGKANGALTKYFLDIYSTYLKQNSIEPVSNFLTNIRQQLHKNKYSQIPQLASENPFTNLMKFDL